MLTEYKSVCGVYLKKDESVIMHTRPAITGMIATWLSAPCFFLLYFIIFYLPSLIRMAISDSFREKVMDVTGASSFSDISITDYIFGNVFGELKGFISGVITFFTIVIISFWVICSLIMTVRSFGYSLAVTNNRVIGNAKGKILDSPLDEVINVFIEQSIWGKFFKYGSVTVRTKKATLTFKNISAPEKFYKKLMDYANSYCAF